MQIKDATLDTVDAVFRNYFEGKGNVATESELRQEWTGFLLWLVRRGYGQIDFEVSTNKPEVWVKLLEQSLAADYPSRLHENSTEGLLRWFQDFNGNQEIVDAAKLMLQEHQ